MSSFCTKYIMYILETIYTMLNLCPKNIIYTLCTTMYNLCRKDIIYTLCTTIYKLCKKDIICISDRIY